MWQIVVVVIGFDGLGFDFRGRTQHPFFLFNLQLIFGGRMYTNFGIEIL